MRRDDGVSGLLRSEETPVRSTVEMSGTNFKPTQSARTGGLWAALLGGMLATVLSFSASTVRAEDPNEAVLEGLQEYQVFVGQWEGSGKSKRSSGWDETIDCGWQFDPKSGGAWLHWQVADKKELKKKSDRILESADLTYVPEKKLYVLRTMVQGEGEPIVFEGKRKSETSLELYRVDKGDSKDFYDRVDISILNDGDRIVYMFKRKFGTKSYRELATVGLNRDGASFAGGGAKGPECIVTGGKGVITVSYNGATYHVCCTGCKLMFEDNPERYVKKAQGGKS